MAEDVREALQFPDVSVLVSQVQAALDEVATWDDGRRRQGGGWTNAIAKAITQRIQEPGIEYAFERNREKREDEREWLFDYCALLFEEKTRDAPRMMAQALVVGEIEFADRKGFDTDFEKLLIVDSLLCFFVFPCWSKDDAEQNIGRFRSFAERRQRIAKLHGAAHPPIFLISCYFEPERKFIHLKVG
jgi:hypothetical protein